jgi:hypothetical protein
MGYLGNTPGENFITFSKQVFTIVNSQTAYTLNFSVVDENEIRLVINNVVQEPGAGKAYTASGTTLTLASALTNGTDEMYCVFLGKARETVTVPTITKDKLNLISNATAGLTVKGDGGSNDGYIALNCSQNSHAVKIKAPPHSAGQSYTLTLPQSITNNTFLKTDGSGNLSFAAAGGINEIDTFRLTSDLSSSNWTLDANLERADHQTFSKLGTGMSESSGIFTFPSTGFYLVQYHQNVTANGDRRAVYGKIMTTHDNGTYVEHYTSDSVARVESNFTATMVSVAVIVDVTDTSNVKVKFGGSSTGTCTVAGNTTANTTYMTFIRLADT